MNNSLWFIDRTSKLTALSPSTTTFRPLLTRLSQGIITHLYIERFLLFHKRAMEEEMRDKSPIQKLTPGAKSK